MIKQLTIRRFKSVKDLTLACRKVNVFVGAPDTGKTNILDALTLMSCLGRGLPFGPYVRLTNDLGFEPLFYRQFLSQDAVISADERTLKMKAERGGLTVQARSVSGFLSLAFNQHMQVGEFQDIRSYAYTSSQAWGYQAYGEPPHETVSWPLGENLLYVTRHHEGVYDFLKDLLAGTGLKLRFDAGRGKFYVSEVRKDDIFDYSLESLSDSVRRMFFYGAILLTSKDATLIFDEPDVYAFPPYPKMLGEMIAEDKSNQCFVTTHNPYFLSALIEKTRASDLGIFVCHRDGEGATQAKLLGLEQIQQMIDQSASVFFNLDEYVQQSVPKPRRSRWRSSALRTRTSSSIFATDAACP